MISEWIELAAAGLLGYSALIEPGMLVHRRNELCLAKLPPGWDGVRIHLVTDIHTNRWTSMEERIRRMLAEPADLILLGGDLIYKNPGVTNIVRMLGDARPAHGIYGVLGNAERKSHVDTRQAMADLENAGVRMLMNDHVVLERNEDRLALVGVDDPYKGAANPAKALAGCPDVFRLMLVHAPQILKWPEIAGTDLILCGHTHGGQVRLPLAGPLMAHTLLERRWSSGLHHGSEIARVFGYPRAPDLFISRGVATGFIHFRFLCWPEVHTLTLRRGA